MLLNVKIANSIEDIDRAAEALAKTKGVYRISRMFPNAQSQYDATRRMYVVETGTGMGRETRQRLSLDPNVELVESIPPVLFGD